MKITKFPSALISGDCTTSSLVLDGGSIIDQCIVTAGERGTFFLEQHLLYVVLGGRVKLACGRQSWTVGKNEMILLRRAQSVSYEKQGSEETGFFESQRTTRRPSLSMNWLTSLAVRCRVSSASSRTSMARRQPAGFVRSDCRRPSRCSARQVSP